MNVIPEATRSFISKFPVDKKGYHVLPCVSLTSENMQEWMKGMRVSIGLGEPGMISSQGSIVDWDDDKITIEIGGHTKKYPYDPKDIQLCVYQFDMGVTFNGTSRADHQELNDETTLNESEEIEESICSEEKEVIQCTHEVEDDTSHELSEKVINVSSYKPKHSIKRS